MIDHRELAGNARTIVLGSTSGIGRAVALALAAAGADVIVHGRSSRKEAEDVAELDTWNGAQLRRCSWPISQIASPATNSSKRHGRCGAASMPGCIWLAPTRSPVRRPSSLSTPSSICSGPLTSVATIRLCRRVGRRMVSQGSGSIVTMGWDQAETGMEGDSGELFAATKGAVLAFTRSLALSLAPTVRVNAIAPGWIKTAWGQDASAILAGPSARRDPTRAMGHSRGRRGRRLLLGQ